MWQSLLADATSDQAGYSTGILGGLIGGAGGVGFAIWYGYYITTKTIPDIVAAFRAERQADREERKAERDDARHNAELIAGAIQQIPCQVGRVPLKPSVT